MVAESRERLITKKRTPTTTSLSVTVHRITCSKEATTFLRCLGVGTSIMMFDLSQTIGLALLH